MTQNEFWDWPCATKGLISYRYKGRFGYVMIGARDKYDALTEASRSIEGRKAHVSPLEVWDGEKYVPVE